MANDGVRIGQHGARPRGDLLSGRRQAGAAGPALDQLHSQRILELAQLRRQRRLADEAFRGGLAEMAAVRDCDQIPQVLEL